MCVNIKEQRMKKYITVALMAAIPTIANADTQTQTVDFDYSAFTGGNISFDQFDSMGGTRELTGLRLTYDQTFDLEVLVESNGPTSLSAGDWDIEAGFYSLHQFGVVTDGRGGDGGPTFPLIGSGGVFDVFTADLGASDGYNGTGPDTFIGSASFNSVFMMDYDRSTTLGGNLLDVFSGEGVLDTYIGGISEILGQWHNDPMWVVDPNNPPEGPWDDNPFIDPYYGFFATFLTMQHSGSIEVAFEYTTVPAPGGTALLLGAGLVGLRRRR